MKTQSRSVERTQNFASKKRKEKTGVLELSQSLDRQPEEWLDYFDCTIAIPTLNEAGNISILVHQLVKQYPGATLLVVDDGSTDGTVDVVNRLALKYNRLFLLDRKSSKVKGIAASLVEALSHSKTTYFAVMDGDLQHPPVVLAELYSAVKGGADLAVAVRSTLVHGNYLTRALFTSLGTLFASFKLRQLSGLRTRDPLSGFFCSRTETIRDLSNRTQIELRGYKFLFDVLRAAPRGFKVDEVRYTFGQRGTGKSKLKPIHLWCFLRSLCSVKNPSQ